MTKEKRKLQARRLWKNRLIHRSILTEKWREAYTSVLPITLIVLFLCFLCVPAPVSAMLGFLLGAVMLIVGMGLFTLGTDLAMTPIGEHVGSAMTRSKKLWLVILISFLVGVIITISEPDLQVLAEQVPGVPNITLILSVALGVGVFLVVALLRILFRIPMKWLLLGCYVLVFVLAKFVPGSFLAVAFDSGGVASGPMTATFLLPLAMGACTAVGGDVATDGTNPDGENRFFGLSIADEKEMLLILTAANQKSTLMRAIMENAGVHSPAHTIMFSLPVESVAGLRSVMAAAGEIED